jgi:hypothetical protein
MSPRFRRYDGAMRYGPVLVLIFAVVNAGPAEAQQRPLPIEPVAGVGVGNLSLEFGADYARGVRFTLSGLEGNLWRLALLRIDVGLSDIADFELSGGLRDRLEIASTTPAVLSNDLRLRNPSSTSAFDDIMVGTKVRLVRETSERPGLAVRITTRLPNAKHPSGLGQNTTDFYSTLVVGQSVLGTQITGNIGFGILGDPLRGNRRVDSALYGVALNRVVTTDVALVAEIDGRTGPLEPGLESRAIARAGAIWTHGPTRLSVDATMGLTDRDGGFGVAFNAGFILRRAFSQ